MLPLSTILEKLNPLDKHTPLPSEYFLSLVIAEKRVKSAIWWFSGQKILDLTFGFTEDWGGETAEDLVIAADASIASAVTQLRTLEGKLPSKVILGLPEHWVLENSITKEKLPFLQAVCKKLQLKPLGFVVIPEAVAHYLNLEEGGFPNAILVNVSEAEIIVSLIVKGKYLGSKVVGRSDSLVLDLEEGLLRFGYGDVLPSRILLLEDVPLGNMDELKRSLVAYPWVDPDKKLNFLQLPKVDVVDTNFEASAVVVAGCKELGLGVKTVDVEAKELPAESAKTIEEETTEDLPRSLDDFQNVSSQRPSFISEISESINTEVVDPDVSDAHAFTDEMLEKKVDQDEGETAEAVSTESLPPIENLGEDLGFVFGADILADQSVPRTSELQVNESQTVKESQFVETEKFDDISAVVNRVNKRAFHLKLPELGSFFGFFQRLKLPKISLRRPLPPRVSFGFSFNKGLLWVIGILALFLGGGSFAFWNLAKAEVKIFVQPLKIDKEFEFKVLDKESQVNSTEMIIPARVTEVEVFGERSSPVTGKKLVGDKAVGEVVIYNRTEQVKNLAKGSILKGPGGLKFLLNDEVKVASKTADLVNGVDRWGEAKVGVTAADIGAQYNIAADSQLSFESISSSSLMVKNPTAFSGGTSREIQAVSKEDRERLQKDLAIELQEKAQGEIQASLSDGNHLLVDSIMLKNKTDAFSHEVGAEADNISLQTKAVYTAEFIEDEDFQTLVREVVSKDLSGEYQDRPIQGESNFSVKDKKKGIFTARVKQDYLPKLEIGSLPQKLKGVKVSKAEEILKANNSHASGLQFLISPKLFAVLKILPLKPQNINVTIEML